MPSHLEGERRGVKYRQTQGIGQRHGTFKQGAYEAVV